MRPLAIGHYCEMNLWHYWLLLFFFFLFSSLSQCLMARVSRSVYCYRCKFFACALRTCAHNGPRKNERVRERASERTVFTHSHSSTATASWHTVSPERSALTNYTRLSVSVYFVPADVTAAVKSSEKKKRKKSWRKCEKYLPRSPPSLHLVHRLMNCSSIRST